jgi:hypothetical protein
MEQTGVDVRWPKNESPEEGGAAAARNEWNWNGPHVSGETALKLTLI